MKITQTLNLKFIFTFWVLSTIVLAPVTGSATSHHAIHTSAFDASISVNKKGSGRVDYAAKKPAGKHIVIRNEKSDVLHKNVASKKNTDFRIACDCPGLIDRSYLIHIYSNKDLKAKSSTSASGDSWEVPIAKTEIRTGPNRF